MFFHPKNLKSENNNPWFNILLHTQSIVCATVDSQCLEYLGYITLGIHALKSYVYAAKVHGIRCSFSHGRARKQCVSSWLYYRDSELKVLFSEQLLWQFCNRSCFIFSFCFHFLVHTMYIQCSFWYILTVKPNFGAKI